MCGIIAYTGSREAIPFLLDGLTSLEYRGYDSAGLYTPEDGVFRAIGAVANLRALVPKTSKAHSGIAHTRWATHGAPSVANAHPHQSSNATATIVHNGIIENYRELKDVLHKAGNIFLSETDTEVLAHLVGREYKRTNDPSSAVTAALAHVRGTYGIAVMFAHDPHTLYVAAMGSPVAIGIGKHEMWVASDASALVPYTKRVVYLEDGEYAVVTPESYTIRTMDNVVRAREPQMLDIDTTQLQKNGYEHFMLKEIMEGPEVVQNAMLGRLSTRGTVKLGGLETVRHELTHIERLQIVGCGSAYYAGMYGKCLIEEYVGIPVDVVLGSEQRYRPFFIEGKKALLAITQSGETADTLASVKAAKADGVLTLGLVNVVGSTIAREVTAGVYTHAGPEVGVASTKAFLSQLTALNLIALYLAELRGVQSAKHTELAVSLLELPRLIQSVHNCAGAVMSVAKKYKDARDMLFIGRKYNVSTAHEGALKLKEVSYLHAEGYAAGEMKHGPLAMIDPTFPTFAIVPNDSVYEKMISNIEEIRARGGPIIAVATEGNTVIESLATDVLWIPKVPEPLTPILVAVVEHLFAYHVGTARGYNVDRPRNLAKSVTVE